MAEFKKEIRLFDAIMMVSGTMIGSGIFIVSADIARTVGTSGYLILVWAISGFITLVGALSYGELAGMMPRAGGQYYYLRKIYGPLTAFTYGWALFLVIQTGTIAAVGVAFAKFTAYFIPWFSENHFLLDFGSFKISAAQLLSIAIIWFLTWMNINGVRNGKLIQNFFGSTKILAILVLIVLGFSLGSTSIWFANQQGMWNPMAAITEKDAAGTVHLLGREPLMGMGIVFAIGMAMVGSLFSSDAWNNISFAGDEIKNPKRTLPVSLAIGTILVTLLYIVVNLVYIYVLPISGSPDGSTPLLRGIQFAETPDDRVAVAAAVTLGGQAAAMILAGLIMISTFSCLNGCILAGARVYYKMADDGLFFPKMAKLNNAGVPGFALIMQAVWASLLCLSGSYGNLLDFVMFTVVLFYILTIFGIFILRVREPNAERPYRAFGYPVLPALYILLAGGFCTIILIMKPLYTWPGLGLVILGGIVFFALGLNKRFKEKEEDSEELRVNNEE